MLAHYLSLLGGELFTRLYIFCEPNADMGQLMDIDVGLCPIGNQFLEVPMVQEEVEDFNEALAEGWEKLAQNFMNDLQINNNVEIQMHNVM